MTYDFDSLVGRILDLLITGSATSVDIINSLNFIIVQIGCFRNLEGTISLYESHVCVLQDRSQGILNQFAKKREIVEKKVQFSLHVNHFLLIV